MCLHLNRGFLINCIENSDLVIRLVAASVAITAKTISNNVAIKNSIILSLRYLTHLGVRYRLSIFYSERSMTPIPKLLGSRHAKPISAQPKKPCFWTRSRVGSSCASYSLRIGMTNESLTLISKAIT